MSGVNSTTNELLVGVTKPQQNRSIKTFSKIKAAALTLMSDPMTMDFRLTDVSRLAKVSIGSIYARVDGKADLVRLVQHEELLELESDLRNVAERATIATALEDAVQTLTTGYLELTMRRAPLLKYVIRAAQSDVLMSERGQRSLALVQRLFVDALRSATDRAGLHPTVEELEWCYYLTDSTIAHQIRFPTPGSVAESTDAAFGKIADRLSDTIRAYLLR